MNFVDGITEIYIDDLNMSSYSNAFAVSDSNLQAQITALSNDVYSVIDIDTSNFYVNSNLFVSGTAEIDGITTLNNNLIVGTGGTTRLMGTLGVTGITSLYSNLIVDGANSTTTLSGTLGVTGITTLSSNLIVSGANSTTTLGGTLGVTGITTLSSNLVVSGTKTTTLGGTLGVTGITTLSSNLVVSGANSTTLGGTLAVTGITTLSSNLVVSGARTTTLGGTLGVTGVTTLSSSLAVTGSASFSSNISCAEQISSTNFSSSIPSLHLRNGNSLYVGSKNTQIEFAGTGGTYKSYIHTTHNSSAANNGIHFYTYGGGTDDIANGILSLSLRNGSVGIGTTNPGYPLDVTGNGRVTGNLYVGTTGVDNNSIYLAGGYGDNVSTYSGVTRRIWDGVESSEVIMYSFNDASDRVKLLGGMIHFDTYTSACDSLTAGYTRMAIDSGGNVGIGSTAPRAKLDIKRISSDSTSMIGLSIGNGDYSGNYLKPQIQFYYDDNTNTGWSHFLHTRHIDGTSTGNAIDFYTCSGLLNNTITSGVNHALTLSGGYVGIGTSSPVDALHIHKPFATSGYYETAGITFTSTTSSYNWITAAITPYIASGSGNSIANFPGGLLFKTSTATSGGAVTTAALAPRMCIDSQGYVGINKMNPSYQFDVSGTSRLTGTVYIGSGSGDVFQSFCANNTFNNYVGCSGYLGVNGATANSSYPLVVTGNVLADHYTTQGSTGGSGTVNTGTVNCGTLSCSTLSYGGNKVVISGTSGLYITRGTTGNLGATAAINQGPITFGHTYSSAPTVTVSGVATDGSFTASVASVSTTSFYVSWGVGGEIATKKISWIAIGV